MNWNDLTEKQKKKFKEYADFYFGKTFSKCETGEPLYFDEDGNIINTQKIIDFYL